MGREEMEWKYSQEGYRELLEGRGDSLRELVGENPRLFRDYPEIFDDDYVNEDYAIRVDREEKDLIVSTGDSSLFQVVLSPILV